MERSKTVKIHESSDVKSNNIGSETTIWQYCVVFTDAIIGNSCNICSHVLIEDDVILGSNVTVKSGVQLWNGLRVGNNVFIGPNATFTNDLIPRSKSVDWEQKSTVIEDGASIGANATILAGITIGSHALIGAGAVVTKDVPSNTVWYGNPARMMGRVTNRGKILDRNGCDSNGNPVPLDD